MKQNKLKIAITGGIGSGKSTACEIIKRAGYPVFSCDETYAELFESGVLTEELVKAFGKEILGADGKLSRDNISGIVFKYSEKLKKLNAITHPKIFGRMFSKADESKGEVCFFEVPLLFEGGYEKLFDKIIVVMRDENQRIESVMARDNKTREQVVSRLKKQLNYNNCGIAQYYVIHNNGKMVDFSAKINELLLKITSC